MHIPNKFGVFGDQIDKKSVGNLHICCSQQVNAIFRQNEPALETSSLPASRRKLPRQKTVENAASDGFGSNFSGAAFYPPHQLVAQGSPNFTRLSGTTIPTNLLYRPMTSLLASGRLPHANLQQKITYIPNHQSPEYHFFWANFAL